jgi:hypothetical protein
MKYSPIIATTLLLLTLSSCWKQWGVCKDASLSITSKPIIKKLRLDGYYYRLGDTSLNGKAYINFLFENGVVYYKPETISDSEAINGTFVMDNSMVKQIQLDWGVYRISDNDTIELESWTPRANKCFKAMRTWGHILNDTTYELYYVEVRDFKGNISEASIVNKTIKHFRKFPIKPDSTNDFVK